MFDAVASRDLEGIIVEYIQNARNTIVSYLSLKKRWRCEQTQGKNGHFRIVVRFYSTSYGENRSDMYSCQYARTEDLERHYVCIFPECEGTPSSTIEAEMLDVWKVGPSLPSGRIAKETGESDD